MLLLLGVRTRGRWFDSNLVEFGIEFQPPCLASSAGDTRATLNYPSAKQLDARARSPPQIWRPVSA